jgi:hypothetical protein
MTPNQLVPFFAYPASVAFAFLAFEHSSGFCAIASVYCLLKANGD